MKPSEKAVSCEAGRALIRNGTEPQSRSETLQLPELWRTNFCCCKSYYLCYFIVTQIDWHQAKSYSLTSVSSSLICLFCSHPLPTFHLAFSSPWDMFTSRLLFMKVPCPDWVDQSSLWTVASPKSPTSYPPIFPDHWYPWVFEQCQLSSVNWYFCVWCKREWWGNASYPFPPFYLML